MCVCVCVCICVVCIYIYIYTYIYIYIHIHTYIYIYIVKNLFVYFAASNYYLIEELSQQLIFVIFTDLNIYSISLINLRVINYVIIQFMKNMFDNHVNLE